MAWKPMAPFSSFSSSSSASSRPSSLLAVFVLVLLGYAVVSLVVVRPQLAIQSESAKLRHASEMHLLQQRQDADPEPTPAPAEQLPPSTTTEPPVSEPPSPEEKRRRAREKLERRCYAERDYGMVAVVRAANQTLCDSAAGVDPSLASTLSTYTHYESKRAGLRATLVSNLWVDLRNAEVFKQIQNVSQDGHLHDPRFKHWSVDAFCACNAHQDQNTTHGVPVWELLHGDHPLGEGEYWRFCRAFKNKQHETALSAGVSSEPWNKTLIDSVGGDLSKLTPPTKSTGWPYPVHYVKRNAIIVGRRDDHNPFFQISVALNAWIMMKVLDWSPETTQLVYFDDGFPATTDELQRRVLAPVHPVVLGRDVLGSVVHFDKALVAPFEYSGPMMRHLNNNEPCRRNALVRDFRDLVMNRYGVSRAKRDPASCTITVISRRPYAGRMVQRKWLNEDAVLERMRDDYARDAELYRFGACRIQSLDFVGLSLEDQMRIVVESDVVIGMHGAGMVNVLWARPETAVVEIFPAKRKRWGYRNLCFFVGCKWFQFRGGTDTGTGDNSSDKLISYGEWFAFFDPIIREAIGNLEARVSGNFRR